MAKTGITVKWRWRGLWICEVLGRRAYGVTKIQATRHVFDKILRNRERMERFRRDMDEIIYGDPDLIRGGRL